MVSWDSDRLQDEWPEFGSWWDQDYSTAFRLALRSTQPPVQWVPRVLSPVVKHLRREADHSPPSGAEVKMMDLCLHSPIYHHSVVLH
jgi:hypothetical protein